MTEEEIRQTIEQVDPDGKIPEDTVNQLIGFIMDKIEPEFRNAVPEGSVEESLRKQISEETDWRKKAEIAARLISHNLS